MITFTYSQGKVLTYTYDCLETILLQCNSSNTYYTSGENDIIFTKIGYNKTLVLDYLLYQSKYFSNYTISEIRLIIMI